MNQPATIETEIHKSNDEYLALLLAHRDFKEAVRYFDSIKEQWDGLTTLESGVIMRLGAKAYCSIKDFVRALVLVRTAISVISKAKPETEELGECYLILGEILRELGNLESAEKAFRDAESIFRRNDNISKAGDALNLLAGILFRKGDFDNALKYLLEAVEPAKMENDRRRLAFLFGNIGRIFLWLGRMSSAEEHIRLNIELSAELNDEIELARAYLSLAYLLIQMERFDSAENALNDAMKYIKKNNLAREEVILLTYWGELALKSGKLDQADRFIKDAITRGNNISPESLLAARPLRVQSEILAKQGEFYKALMVAGRAMVLMQKINDQIEIASLYRIQGYCHGKLDEFTEARKLLNLSVEILEEKKAKSELADSLVVLGQLDGLEAGMKMIYLYRAHEIYNACGMKYKLLRLEKDISKLELNFTSMSTGDTTPAELPDEYPTRNTRMAQILSQLNLIRGTDLPILLTGETGTGKDFIAKYFHSISRPQGPFVSVNCAAVPETLMESELFGYQKGAFTGAESDKKGLFLAANNGVILLDEIGELPLALQAKLLSIIESKRLRPLGTHNEIELNLIIIAATNRDLFEMVKKGTFRSDLYYRLAGITIELPPLRERKEDIPYLVELFMRRQGLLNNGNSPEPELVRMFINCDWPGNIRQLENKVKHLSALWAMAKEGSIVEILRGFFDEQKDEATNSLFEQVERFEKRLLLDALSAAGGNKSEAARILSIHESTLRAKMKRYSLAGA
jgi:DNA-binding NtrC family response regulator/Flp pilus assembly protein TadD